jgi:hypothetical protein
MFDISALKRNFLRKAITKAAKTIKFNGVKKDLNRSDFRTSNN